GKVYDGKRAYFIFNRDRFNHASPNSAQTEAVSAGALGIQLAGNASYFGKLVEKPYIGDRLREIEYADIIKVNRLLYAAAMLCEGICLIIMMITVI
ncbi:MAG: cobalamin biosynthesis protein, partial [Cellulosilyticum sp.]|nr:cobalamin biosynthesis protein [Cellulosilyticum sp.]